MVLAMFPSFQGTGTSLTVYKPGSATEEYKAMVDKAVQIAEAQKKRVDPMYHEKIDGLLDAYARKLAENLNSGYTIDARVPSVLIAGPVISTGAKEKQNAARDRNMEEWRKIQGLLDKMKSTGTGGISADDPDAVGKLREKLENLEESQETMKFVNDYYRKHNTLDRCPYLTQEQVQKLKSDMASSWHYGKAMTIINNCDNMLCLGAGRDLETARYISYRNYYDSYWMPLIEQMGMNHRPHDTRHTCVSMLTVAGVDDKIIKKIVGHKGQSVTETVYTHFEIQELLEAINRI